MRLLTTALAFLLASCQTLTPAEEAEWVERQALAMRLQQRVDELTAKADRTTEESAELAQKIVEQTNNNARTAELVSKAKEGAVDWGAFINWLIVVGVGAVGGATGLTNIIRNQKYKPRPGVPTVPA